MTKGLPQDVLKGHRRLILGMRSVLVREDEDITLLAPTSQNIISNDPLV